MGSNRTATYEKAQAIQQRMSAGRYHSLIIKANGTVEAWGAVNTNEIVNYGQCDVPEGLDNVIQVSAGYLHSLALKADGSLEAWGQNGMPAEFRTIQASGQEFIAVSAGGQHSLALRKNGRVEVWGNCPAIAPEYQGEVTAIAAGGDFSLALLVDGSLLVWGDTGRGQGNIPSGNDFKAIAAGDGHCLALRENGTVEVWGYDQKYQCSAKPADLRNVIAISAGVEFSMALVQKSPTKAEIVVWGDGCPNYSLKSYPYNVNMAISAGGEHFLFAANYLDTGTEIDLGPAYGTTEILRRRESRIEVVGADNHGQCSQAPADLNLVGYFSDFQVEIDGEVIVLEPIPEGTWDFDYQFRVPEKASDLRYMFRVPNEIKTVKYKIIKECAQQSLGGATNDSWGSLNLGVGYNPMAIQLSLEQEGLSRAYQLVFFREYGPTDLELLVTEKGEHLKFASTTTSYTTNVNQDVEEIDITAIRAHPEATVTINGVELLPTENTLNVPINYGKNTITIDVTKEGAPTKTYTVTVNKAGFLKDLQLQEGQPYFNFDPEFHDYPLNINSTTTTLEITPFLKCEDHQLFIVDSLNNDGEISHGEAVTIELADKKYQQIKLLVKIPDSSVERTYTLSINRITAEDLIGTGSLEDPYLIFNLHTLQEIACDSTLLGNEASFNYYRLMTDLNAVETKLWNNGNGFIPIGTLDNPFCGYFDGNGHQIKGLYLNSSLDGAGLFGATYKGEIINLGLVDCEIKGKNKVGGLIGENKDTFLDNCFVTGEVSGTSKIGGLIGVAQGTAAEPRSLVSNCYTQTDVGGEFDIAGLIADLTTARLENCYAAGTLVGVSDSAEALNCFWDQEKANSGNSALGTPKTTTELQTAATYAAWDFTYLWGINDAYPHLLVFENEISPFFDNSLVLWLDAKYGSNEAKTPTWQDLSGKGIDGELKGFDFTESSGWRPEGLRFDGYDDCVDYGDYLDLRQYSRTYSFWFMSLDLDYASNVYFCSKADNDATPFRHGFCIYPQGEQLSGTITDCSNYHQSFRVDTTDLIKEGVFYNLVWVIDREASFQEIFLNGHSLGREELIIRDQDFIIKNRPFRLGSYTQQKTNLPISFLGGYLNQVRIYNQAITLGEIEQNYEAELREMKKLAAANLAHLAVAPGTIQPFFRANRLEYNAVLVDPDEQQITVTAEAQSVEALVQIGMEEAVRGRATAEIMVQSGRNVIPIKVTEADGFTKTYVLTVIKPCYLAGLELAETSLTDFEARTFEYLVSVANETETIKVKPLLDLDESIWRQITINNLVFTGVPVEIDLPKVGENNQVIIKLNVIDCDPVTYVVNVYRALSIDIKEVQISPEVIWEPEFAPGIIEYRLILADEAKGAEEIKITPLPYEPTVSLEVTAEGGVITPVQGIYSLSLKDGINALEIKTLVEQEEKVYFFEIIKPVYLEDLEVTAKNAQGEGTFISMEFSSIRYEYELIVDNEITALEITPIVNDGVAVKISGAVARNEYSLEVGENIFWIKVSVEGTEKVYALNVYRTPSAEVGLEKIELKHEGNCLPLSKSDDVYSILLESPLNSLDLEVKAKHEAARVEVMGETGREVNTVLTVKPGVNRFTILVIPEDGENSVEYGLEICRKAFLTGLIINSR